MAVKLDIFANVKGTNKVDSLNRGVNKLGKEATVAATRMKNLEVAAARSRATFSALGNVLKGAVTVGLGAVTLGIGKFVKDTFAAGKLTESLQVRFKLLFNSVEEGAKAFDVMNKFASKVPFSLEAIAAGSGNLAVISKDANELSKILEVTGNVAAATGLDFRQTAEQIQRSFAGGIAAADVFRERGVRNMLGFAAGAKVSIEDTQKRFFEVFANGGKFSQATKDFENTLEAQVSFVGDAYFRIRQEAAKPLFAGVTRQVRELVGDFKKNDEQIKKLSLSIGRGLANAFKKLGDFIKFVIANMDELILVVKAFIGIKIIGFLGNFVSQLALLVINLKSAKTAAVGLNVALRANPIGIVVTALQGLTLAAFYFREEIKAVSEELMKNFNENLLKIKKTFLQFKNLFKIGNKDVNTEGIEKINRELDGTAQKWREAADARDAYKEKSLKQKGMADRFQNFEGANPRGDMRKAENEAQMAYIKKINDAQNKAWSENKKKIVENATARAEAERQALENIKLYREQLSNVGIDAKGIADTISTTWLEGLREGNSLLEITKNTFRNVLNTIAETMLQKSIEYGVEQIFQALLGNRVSIEKQVTKEKTKQLAIQAAITAMGGGGGGGGGGPGAAFSNAFGMNEGGIVPGGAPYTDRVPTMLTPGELVVPRKNFNDVAKGNSSNITNINISGNVDQRSIDQIQGIIAQSSAQVGGANRTYQSNTRGVRGRNR
jgi:hypothetical protein